MRINPSQVAQPLPEGDRTSDRTSNQTAAGNNNRVAASSPLGEDQAQLSGGHVQVQALAAQVAQFPEIRQEKVAALRQVVLNGSYQRSSKQVAAALFEHMVVMPAA
jgi:flagellar biosynthesis anti-sigma factor FlgM